MVDGGRGTTLSRTRLVGAQTREDAHCPHGRPVVRTLDYTELADWFDR